TPQPERRTVLPLRTQAAIFLRLLAIQGSWNYEILLGNGIGFCLEPALRLLPEGMNSQHFKDALARESKYIKAHPYLAPVAGSSRGGIPRQSGAAKRPAANRAAGCRRDGRCHSARAQSRDRSRKSVAGRGSGWCRGRRVAAGAVTGAH